jgi:hypothetical protein
MINTFPARFLDLSFVEEFNTVGNIVPFRLSGSNSIGSKCVLGELTLLKLNYDFIKIEYF